MPHRLTTLDAAIILQTIRDSLCVEGAPFSYVKEAREKAMLRLAQVMSEAQLDVAPKPEP